MFSLFAAGNKSFLLRGKIKKKKEFYLEVLSDEPKRGTKVMVSWFHYDIDNICRRDFELCLGKSVREGRVAYVA